MNIDAMGRHQTCLKERPNKPSGQHDTVEPHRGWYLGNVKEGPQIQSSAEAHEDDQKQGAGHSDIERTARPATIIFVSFQKDPDRQGRLQNRGSVLDPAVGSVT